MPSSPTDQELCHSGQAVVRIEAEAVAAMAERIDSAFAAACRLMLVCRGRIVVTGMGKSGHIGSKIAATLASTGSPAFFVHPGEAGHGDLGMITTGDVVLALSNSGETGEIVTILPHIKRRNIVLITMTGNPDSTLARQASVHINVGVKQEACPLGLAPTSSTTAVLAMGDALAVALLEARGFTQDDFALSHPSGSLGRRLLLRIDDIMHVGEAIPAVPETALLSEAVLVMSEKKLGMTTVVDANFRLRGIFTDGDLRRLFAGARQDIHATRVAEVMTRDCAAMDREQLAAEALRVMEDKKINALPIVDRERKLVGALNMHDLLHAGIV